MSLFPHNHWTSKFHFNRYQKVHVELEKPRPWRVMKSKSFHVYGIKYNLTYLQKLDSTLITFRFTFDPYRRGIRFRTILKHHSNSELNRIAEPERKCIWDLKIDEGQSDLFDFGHIDLNDFLDQDNRLHVHVEIYDSMREAEMDIVWDMWAHEEEIPITYLEWIPEEVLSDVLDLTN